jgi:hypothetical protein
LIIHLHQPRRNLLEANRKVRHNGLDHHIVGNAPLLV